MFSYSNLLGWHVVFELLHIPSLHSNVPLLPSMYHPTLRDDCKLYIKHEVTIQNRRPDFVIHVPNVALILLEYKTSNVTTKVRREYLTQVLDTYHKFRQSLCVSENSSHIRLLSILLIRNSSSRQNKIVCVKNELIPNSCYLI